MGPFPRSLELMEAQSLVHQQLSDLVLGWVKLLIALDKDVQVKCEINYEKIYSINQTHSAMAICILKEKVIKQHWSDTFIFPSVKFCQFIASYELLGIHQKLNTCL